MRQCHDKQPGLSRRYGSYRCSLRSSSAEYADRRKGADVDRREVGGRLIYLPADSSASSEAFLDDVLVGWRRAQIT